MKKDVQLFGLRIPDNLREELGEIAKNNGRSVTAEIILRLEQSVQTDRETRLRHGGSLMGVIFAANAAIARHQQEIAAAIEALESGGALKVAEEKPSYNAVVNMLPAADREAIALLREMSKEARASLVNLLKQTAGGKN